MSPHPERIVTVFTPSDPVKKNAVMESKDVLERAGIPVQLSRYAFLNHRDYAAGSVDQRAADLCWAVGNGLVNWVSYGGYSAIDMVPVMYRLIPQIAEQGNRLVGYSDTDLLANVLFANNIPTVYAPHFGSIGEWGRTYKRTIINYLKGEPLPPLNHGRRWSEIIPGEAEGRLLVTGVDSLRATARWAHDPMDGDGSKVLFLEEVDQDTADFVRDLKELKLDRSFGNVAGIVIGRLAGVKERVYKKWKHGLTMKMILRDLFGNSHIPVAMYAGFGHAPESAKNPPFTPLLKGKEVKLIVDKRESGLIYTSDAR